MDSISKAGQVPMSVPAAAREPKADAAKAGDVSSPVVKDDVVLSTSLKAATADLKPGEKITITIDGKKAAEIEKTAAKGVSVRERISDTIQGVALEVKQLADNDPSFAFRETVHMAKNTVLNEAPEIIQKMTTKGLLPTIRLASLGIDLRKAWTTIKDPNAKMLQKIVDVAHCVTDFLGCLSTFSWAIPAVAPAASVLMTICVIGDVMAFGTHSLSYLADRAKKSDLLEKPKETKGEEAKPAR